MAHNSQNADNNKRMEISQQQISIIAALCLTLAFFIFIAGVFWGKKSILERTPTELTGDIFTDRIYSTFSRSSGVIPNQVNKEKLEAVTEGSDESLADTSEVKDGSIVVNDQNKNEEFYYAQLAAFNTEQEAHNCMRKLSKRGLHIRLMERLSKTKAGEMKAWYTVVTEPFRDKDHLITFVQKIKRIRLVKDYTVLVINDEQKNLLFGKKGE